MTTSKEADVATEHELYAHECAVRELCAQELEGYAKRYPKPELPEDKDRYEAIQMAMRGLAATMRIVPRPAPPPGAPSAAQSNAFYPTRT